MCPSEVSDIEHSIWQKYKDQGLIVWGIGAQDSWANLETFTEQMGLTYPVLFDDSGEVKAQYNPGKTPTNSVYPQDWIIGVDGTVVYVNTEFEPDEMSQIIETELEKMNTIP